jgi:hypothetical protein
MNIVVLSYNGKVEKNQLENISAEDITKIMDSIDWNLFHQVILSRNKYDWIEVGGNLKEAGLSCIYEEKNEQFVIDIAPSTIDQLTDILLSYYSGDGEFKIENTFIGENKNRPYRKSINQSNENIIRFVKRIQLKLVFRFLSLIILVIIYGYFRVNQHDPFIYSIFVIIIGVIWIFYELNRRKNDRLEKIKEEKRIQRLKSRIESFRPSLNTENLPKQFIEYIPLFEKWGNKNSTLRADLYENSNNSELLELKSIESIKIELENYISENKNINSVEKKAIKLTLEAYNDLGLWTWNNNKN